MRKIIGILMLGILYAALFVITIALTTLELAIIVWSICIGLMLFIAVAAYLIT